MTPIFNPDAFEDLLDADERVRPGVIFVGSTSCPSCERMRPLYQRLARWLQAFDFYELNVDDFAEPAWDGWLTALFRDLELQYIPAQILLPSIGAPQVVMIKTPADFRQVLDTLY